LGKVLDSCAEGLRFDTAQFVMHFLSLTSDKVKTLQMWGIPDHYHGLESILSCLSLDSNPVGACSSELDFFTFTRQTEGRKVKGRH